MYVQKQTAQNTMQFLRDKDIRVTKWPAYSPYLNPIENVWFLMKRYVHREQPSTPGELVASITAAWNFVVTHTLCQKLLS